MLMACVLFEFCLHSVWQVHSFLIESELWLEARALITSTYAIFFNNQIYEAFSLKIVLTQSQINFMCDLVHIFGKIGGFEAVDCC